MKKVLTICSTLFMVTVFFIFSPFQASGETLDIKVPFIKSEKRVLRLATSLPIASPYGMGALRFAELVEIYTRGEIKVKVFPSAQLGTEQGTAKMVQLGTLDLTLVPVNNCSMWYRPLDVYCMPFIFRDREHVNKVLFGPVGKEMEKNYLKASNMRIVSWFEWGDRAIFNNKRAINKPSDLIGIKMRVPKNSVMVDTYNALGATSTAIAQGDLHSALQQGLADGVEGPPQGMIDFKFTDFLEYYSYIPIFYGVSDILLNENVFQSLSEENQAAILKAGKEAGDYQRWISTVSHVDGLKKLAELGIKVNKVENKQAFEDQLKPVWDKYRKKIGDKWFDAVINTK